MKPSNHRSSNSVIRSSSYVTSQVSRAGYYKWLRRIGIPQTRETENMKIIEEMNEIHLSVKGIYGYRRMTLNLKRRFGRNVNAKRVRRLMHVAGIHCVIRRKRPLYIRNRPQQTAEDILNRDFNAAEPNQKWVTERLGIEVRHLSEGIFERHTRFI